MTTKEKELLAIYQTYEGLLLRCNRLMAQQHELLKKSIQYNEEIQKILIKLDELKEVMPQLTGAALSHCLDDIVAQQERYKAFSLLLIAVNQVIEEMDATLQESQKQIDDFVSQHVMELHACRQLNSELN